MTPTIGRIVHYVVENGSHRPAVIVAVHGHLTVDLHVFVDPTNDGLIPFQRFVLSDEQKNKKTWHWPERVTE